MVRSGREREVRDIQGLTFLSRLASFFGRHGDVAGGVEGGTGTGRAGEEMAARWLRRRGYRIEARNYRCRAGELDIVASRKGLLVFVEVKTRSGTGFGSAAEAVGGRKQKRISRAADAYLLRFNGRNPAARFDVLEVIGDNSEGWRVVHTPDAFRPGWEVS